MISVLKVEGKSLSPDYHEGDFVLVLKIPFLFNNIKPGDTLVFRHAEYGTMIKKVECFDKQTDEITVVGTHQFSVDSRRFGPIQKQDVVGKVVWRIR